MNTIGHWQSVFLLIFTWIKERNWTTETLEKQEHRSSIHLPAYSHKSPPTTKLKYDQANKMPKGTTQHKAKFRETNKWEDKEQNAERTKTEKQMCGDITSP